MIVDSLRPTYSCMEYGLKFQTKFETKGERKGDNGHFKLSGFWINLTRLSWEEIITAQGGGGWDETGKTRSSPVQGGRSWGSAGAALPERSGSSTKGRTSNIRYFVAKPSIVAIYALFERLSQGFQLKPSCSHRACFLRAFNKSNPSFVEFSAKAILLS